MFRHYTLYIDIDIDIDIDFIRAGGEAPYAKSHQIRRQLGTITKAIKYGDKSGQIHNTIISGLIVHFQNVFHHIFYFYSNFKTSIERIYNIIYYQKQSNTITIYNHSLNHIIWISIIYYIFHMV
jgi:hypothetical protein